MTTTDLPAIDISEDARAFFPSVKADFTKFKRNGDVYSQSTKTSADTVSDNRIEIHVPHRGVLLRDFAVVAKIGRITTAGVDVGNAANTAASQTLHSAPHLIERIQILNGNSSGPVIFEIGSTQAWAFLDMHLQGKDNADEYGYYMPEEKDYNGSGYVIADRFDSTDDAGLADKTDFLSQTDRIVNERLEKYRRLGLDGNFSANQGQYTLLRFRDLPRVLDHLPLAMLVGGITIRIDLRTDAFHCVNKRPWTGNMLADASAQVATPDTRFKLTDIKCITDELIPDPDFMKMLLDEQINQGKMIYPWYKIETSAFDVSNLAQTIQVDSSGARVEMTDLAFYELAGKPYSTAGDANTSAGKLAVMANTNQLLFGGTAVFGDVDERQARGKSIRFWPKISRMSIQVNGADHPSSTIYDNADTYPQRAYEQYVQQFKGKEKLMKFEDWLYRYNKIRFDYRGQKGIFGAVPSVRAEEGENVLVSNIRLDLQLGVASVQSAANLRGFACHWVPSNVILLPKGQMARVVM